MDPRYQQGTPGQLPQPQQPPYQPQAPVAYDVHGRPLYSAPMQQPTAQPMPDPVTGLINPDTSSHVTATQTTHPGHNFDPQLRAQYANEPQVVHAARPIEPTVPNISPELQAKHEESKRRYPFLNLSQGEYVIMMVQRHPVGLLVPVIVTFLIILLAVVLMIVYPMITHGSDQVIPVPYIVFGSLGLIILAAIGGYISVWIYLRNMFFLTNESVIQEIQMSLFAKREQTVSLGSIEDASFLRAGLLQTLLDYGTIRLSTEGEETTYMFQYASNPKQQVATLNDAIESFKNGRPVGEH